MALGYFYFDDESQRREERRGSETILVVEDDDDVRDVAVTMLNDLGYSTVVATNGSEALAELSNGRRVDLLFTDYVMPNGLDGAELARKARALRPDLKVLLTSGYSRQAIAENVADPSFVIVSKPYRVADLAKRVRAALDGQYAVDSSMPT